MRALCVLVGSVVILAVIQAGSLFVDAKKTHQGHHKALKVPKKILTNCNPNSQS